MRTFVPGASVVHTHSFGGTNEGTEVLLEDDVVKITAVLLRSSTLEGSGANKSKNSDMYGAPMDKIHLLLLFCRGSSYSLHHFLYINSIVAYSRAMQVCIY